jgi:oligopeptide/dipeptide ABC transporter ATP-binding protein
MSDVVVPPTADAPLLSVQDLTASFGPRGDAVRPIIRGISYELRAGETMAVIGESGSGKSVAMKLLIGLMPMPPWTVGGSAKLAGRELLGRSEDETNAVRGKRIGMIFQEALAALNPSLTVGFQIAEMFRFHERMSRKESWEQAVRLLHRVGVSDPEARSHAYPHQFSGGMQQRVGIAMAIATQPQLLIADEPTTALDVTVQAQVLDLLREIQDETGMGVLFVTHDLAVAADFAGTIAVMYAGRIVEMGPAEEVYVRPRHPYTIGLLKSRPATGAAEARLVPIDGSPRRFTEAFTGCSFEPRCPYRLPVCKTIDPAVDRVGAQHWKRCHRDDVHA